MPDDLEDLRPRTVIRERDLARRWRKSVRSLQRLRRGEGGRDEDGNLAVPGRYRRGHVTRHRP